MTVFCSTSTDICFLLPRLLALPTEAWRKAGLCGNEDVNLPGPIKILTKVKHLKGDLLYCRLLALPTNIILVFKGLLGTKSLADYEH
jgi:hypothetical protein